MSDETNTDKISFEAQNEQIRKEIKLLLAEAYFIKQTSINGFLNLNIITSVLILFA